MPTIACASEPLERFERGDCRMFWLANSARSERDRWPRKRPTLLCILAKGLAPIRLEGFSMMLWSTPAARVRDDSARVPSPAQCEGILLISTHCVNREPFPHLTHLAMLDVRTAIARSEGGNWPRTIPLLLALQASSRANHHMLALNRPRGAWSESVSIVLAWRSSSVRRSGRRPVALGSVVFRAPHYAAGVPSNLDRRRFNRRAHGRLDLQDSGESCRWL